MVLRKCQIFVKMSFPYFFFTTKVFSKMYTNFQIKKGGWIRANLHCFFCKNKLKCLSLSRKKYSQFFYAMQCWEKRGSEHIKERWEIYAVRDFSDRYYFTLFKFWVKFMKLLSIWWIFNLIWLFAILLVQFLELQVSSRLHTFYIFLAFLLVHLNNFL